ncbi:hypothetical protein ATE84_4149 [Aquimarina sp. MAR_2010_214]|uniref:DUF6624 domain-containing protein n=1 Tax=Aquimarina sp. MAR_2010_214 TaxID=1250026 RepID=UPI000CAB7461|nr:DUF6624 domain-containing protein [Aquimarina sp. MAR_2010_214]PKV52048.1 hypothetical protein ATE84_4149 [Aquimarina sp. MAR_2010_214]
MKKIIFLLVLVLVFSCKQQKKEVKTEITFKELTVEEKAQYAALKNEAWKLYQSKDYLQSAKKYSEAFGISGYHGNTSDTYNAACSWALTKEIDSALVHLLRIAKRGEYTNYSHITTDSDLSILHSDKRWNQVLALVKANKEKAEINFDKPLVALLDTIYQDDQGPRRQINDIIKKYGRDSDELKQHWKKIATKDSISLIKVEKILDERGWLSKDIIGNRGNTTLFMVIQHADLEVQEKYLPMIKEAVKKGNIRPGSLALLEDRIAIRKGDQQIYGSQVGRDAETGIYYIYPLQDPDHVDKRRAEVGLGPLQDYVSRWDIIWDSEKYKQQLPDLEKKLKK